MSAARFQIWNTDIRWCDGVATVNHTELPNRHSALDAISALREYLESRDLTVARETVSPDCLSWDVVGVDGTMVGAAAIARPTPQAGDTVQSRYTRVFGVVLEVKSANDEGDVIAVVSWDGDNTIAYVALGDLAVVAESAR